MLVCDNGEAQWHQQLRPAVWKPKPDHTHTHTHTHKKSWKQRKEAFMIPFLKTINCPTYTDTNTVRLVTWNNDCFPIEVYLNQSQQRIPAHRSKTKSPHSDLQTLSFHTADIIMSGALSDLKRATLTSITYPGRVPGTVGASSVREELPASCCYCSVPLLHTVGVIR